jgi:hypothetical protein
MLKVFAMNSRPFRSFLTSRTIHHLGQVSYSLTSFTEPFSSFLSTRFWVAFL